MIIILSFCLAVNDNHHYQLINPRAVNEFAQEIIAAVIFRDYLVAVIAIKAVNKKRHIGFRKPTRLFVKNITILSFIPEPVICQDTEIEEAAQPCFVQI
jgi:hypothetical protein